MKVTLRRRMVVTVVLLLGYVYFTPFRSISEEDKNDRYFRIQSRLIQASIAQEFEELKASVTTAEGLDDPCLGRPCLPQYLDKAFTVPQWRIGQSYYADPQVFFGTYLNNEDDAELLKRNSEFVIFDRKTGSYPDMYARKDWETIHALVENCNVLLEENGRLACEFDGGYDFAATPFTNILFNVAYLKYQSQKIVYRSGKYELTEVGDSAVPLDMYDLLRRNALARVVHYRLLTAATSILVEREKRDDSTLAYAHSGILPSIAPTYAELLGTYSWRRNVWAKFLEKGLKLRVDWNNTGFAVDTCDTNEKLTFQRDDVLIDDALREINYYRDKLNFSEHFMVANYPMFLLSILRLYDVNLDWDESGKYIIVPGPTDPQRFFKIAAECTFVNDSSDTEYLKEHLNSWLEPEQK